MKPRRVRMSGSRYNPMFPAGSVIITHGEYWGNPHNVGPCAACDGKRHSRDEAVLLFERALFDGLLPYSVEDVRRELTGHDLACWCPGGEICHGDVLLSIANGEMVHAAS